MRGCSGAPKRRLSSRARGRAPIVKTSRRMPPTPVAAPWYGSMKEGWLWLSILNATASPPAQVHDAGVLPRPLEHPGALRGKFFEVNAAAFVGAVLVPHGGECAEFGGVGAAPQDFGDFLPFARRKPVVERRLQGGGGVRRPHDAAAVRAAEANTRSPSSPPSRGSQQRSGCGMRPTTFPSRLQTPAMFATDPLGFASARARPSASA